MGVDRELLELLACPRCHGSVDYDEIENVLVCTPCQLRYLIRDDIPVLLVDEAFGDPDEAQRVVESHAPRMKLIPRSKTPPADPTPPHPQAVFFPWSVTADDADLKRALLLFDQVGLLGPKSSKSLLKVLDTIAHGDELIGQAGRLPGQARVSLRTFYAQLRPLIEANAVRLIDAEDALQTPAARDHIKQLVSSEIFSPELARSISELDVLPSLMRQIIVSRSESPYHALVLEHAAASGDFALQYWTGLPAFDLWLAVRDEAETRLSQLPPDIRDLVRGRTDLDKSISVSLFCNSALVAIDSLGAAPLITSDFGFDYMDLKYRRARGERTSSSQEMNAQAMAELAMRTDTRSGVLGTMILDVVLPDLSSLSFDDLVQVRLEHADALSRFRFEIIKLSSAIKANTLDRELYRECLDIVATAVVPAVSALVDDLRGSSLRTVRTLLNAATSIKPVAPFIISGFSPLPLGAAAAVSAGILSLEAALALREDAAGRNSNGMAYLLKVSPERIRVDEMWNRYAEINRRFR